MSTVLSQTTYEYDKAHNRTKRVRDGVETNYSYNSLNQLTGFAEGLRQVAFAYDHSGNRISRTEGGVVDSYGYDYENRLVSLQKGGVPYSYTYDYRTRRVERIEGSTATKVVFSSGTSVQEYESGVKAVEYIRGSDMGGGIGGILYTLRSGERPGYTHYNNRGDVVAKTDDEQAVTWQAEYEAFGTRTKEVGQTQDRQKANTKDEDPTDLLNEGFRYRDLETGSFITRDPLGFVDGPNLYTYVQQNPWTKFDPKGLLERNREGKIVMRPAGPPITVTHPSGESWRAQPVDMKTDDGRTVKGYQNLDRSKPHVDADCHGVSVGDGKVWINDDQMKTVLQGDGYQKTQNPKPGDLAVYTDNQGIKHSARVASVDTQTGDVNVTGKGGVEPSVHTDPARPGPGGAWADPTARVDYYTQPRPKPAGQPATSIPPTTGQPAGRPSTVPPATGQPGSPSAGPSSGSPTPTPPPSPSPSATPVAPPPPPAPPSRPASP